MRFILVVALGLLAPVTAAAQTAEAQGTVPVVGVGDGAVDGARIVPRALVRQLFRKQDGTERQVGTIIDSVRFITHAGEPAILRVQRFVLPRGVQLDTAIVRRRDLTPIYHSGHGPRGTLELHFAGATVRGHHAPIDSAAHQIDQALATAVFDSNLYDLLVSALPLRVGYAARLPIYIYERGGLTWLEIRVTGTEPVGRTGGAEEEAWVVNATLAGVPGTFFVGTKSREVLAWRNAAGPGVEMRMAL